VNVAPSAASLSAAGLALALALPISALAQADSDIGLPFGTPAPDVQVEDLDGNSVSLLEAAGGGPALIKFWASWCEQCEALQPKIEEIHRRYAAEVSVVAVAVAVGQSRRRVRRHAQQHDLAYPFLYDADGEAVRAYEAFTTSVVVLLDGNGRIAYTGVGPDQKLVRAVEAMLASGDGGS